MAIPESVLNNWTNYETAAIGSASETYERIDNALKNNPDLADHDFETLLQGSYANTTLVHGSGDVDIVVRLNETWSSDLSNLDAAAKERYRNQTASPSYSWADFRSDVLDELSTRYGNTAITEGDKAIEVDTSSLPLGADIVVCLQHRRYTSFSAYPGDYEKGIAFWTLRAGNKVVNFPEQHIENGAIKQNNTNNRYKPTVRMFKNARNKMHETGMISKDRVPSYFVECLLYNVPAGKFDYYNLQERFTSIVDYLLEDRIEDYICQNELLSLFGPESTQWSVSDANSFITNLARLYNNW